MTKSEAKLHWPQFGKCPRKENTFLKLCGKDVSATSSRPNKKVKVEEIAFHTGSV